MVLAVGSGGNGFGRTIPVYDWDVVNEADGRLVAKLCGTQVMVREAPEKSPGPWMWEVRFADGQTQSGFAPSCDEALDKGKRVAERFLP
jgi:hypothetical protein